ncbi:aldo/keto reductase [Streptomyces sp. NPDC058683]|uniref:aldo/keto reductase n=1 Tax=Streptomyces sp. NPDC058683 TaxID=3346597 RepID=UPI00364878AD
MEYRNLGRTGLKVSRLVFGGLYLGEGLPEDEAADVIAAARHSGVNTFFTADVYGDGAAEEALGKHLGPWRDDAVLIIKAGYRVGTPQVPLGREELNATHGDGALDHAALWRKGIAPTSRGLSRKHLTQALEASLRRLGTDYIDVYAPHFWDYETPIEETLETLEGFVRAGKVRYLGVSQTAPWQLYRALWASDKLGVSRYECVQTRFNILERGALTEYLPAARAAGVSVLAHQSLAGDLLTGRFARDSAKPTGLGSLQRYMDMYWTESTFAFLDRFQAVAQAAGRTMGELAQAWVLAHKPVTSLLVGPRSPDALAPQVAAATKPLTDEERTAVNALLAEGGQSA